MNRTEGPTAQRLFSFFRGLGKNLNKIFSKTFGRMVSLLSSTSTSQTKTINEIGSSIIKSSSPLPPSPRQSTESISAQAPKHLSSAPTIERSINQLEEQLSAPQKEEPSLLQTFGAKWGKTLSHQDVIVIATTWKGKVADRFPEEFLKNIDLPIGNWLKTLPSPDPQTEIDFTKTYFFFQENIDKIIAQELPNMKPEVKKNIVLNPLLQESFPLTYAALLREQSPQVSTPTAIEQEIPATQVTFPIEMKEKDQKTFRELGIFFNQDGFVAQYDLNKFEISQKKVGDNVHVDITVRETGQKISVNTKTSDYQNYCTVRWQATS